MRTRTAVRTVFYGSILAVSLYVIAVSLATY